MKNQRVIGDRFLAIEKKTDQGGIPPGLNRIKSSPFLPSLLLRENSPSPLLEIFENLQLPLKKGVRTMAGLKNGQQFFC